MLVFNDRKFIKSSFSSELEIEKVVIENYEYLFGPDSIYLPKALIRTGDGLGTIPDAFAIDLSTKKWYLVEAELIHHSVWIHIAPQVSKQLIAAQQPSTKKRIEALAVDQFNSDEITKEKFTELGIKDIDVRKVLSQILEQDPIVGVPIDSITNDLKDWALTLKYSVKLWVINKYVEHNNPTNIIYEFPEEFKPDLDTAADLRNFSAKYDISLLDLIEKKSIVPGQKIVMSYKPRNGQQKKYEGVIQDDGTIGLLGKSFGSLSYAAWTAIKDSGSTRSTINGWHAWKLQSGETMAEIRDRFIEAEVGKDI